MNGFRAGNNERSYGRRQLIIHFGAAAAAANSTFDELIWAN